MTVEQRIRELLSLDGIFADRHVDAVMERVKSDEINKPMSQRWNDSANDYSSSVITVLWVSVKRVAVEYIDEVMPLAFFRPMFAE